MITVKIGGSSLRTKADFLNVRDIIKSNEERSVIVVSAPGKRYEADKKVTDLLKEACRDEFSTKIYKVVERFEVIAEGLPCFYEVSKELLKLQQSFFSHTYDDFILSRGEYISSLIMASLLNFKLIDAKDVIFFKENGNVDEEKSQKALRKYLSLYKKIVIPGFYGQNFDGRIKTFPRGGGDITGSVAASLLKASKYENMTDRAGLLKYPPKFFSFSPFTKCLSLYDLKLLSRFGAEIFNEGAADPLIKYNVPLEIKSTFSDTGFTLSFKEACQSDCITGVGFLEKEKYSLILITGKFLEKALNAAFLLNALAAEDVKILKVTESRKTPSLIIKVPCAYFKKALCIIYKRTHLLQEVIL